uniref:Protein kinase domain-containing protein n=1 Tax=Haptolina brevifila TaxID=156173 RepID=A0A7S2IYS4_9EUKA
MEHMEGGKQVSANELLTMRTETIGVGQFSRVRLVEVKQLRKYLETLLPPEEAGKEPTIADPPEVSMGVFALKVMKKTEVVRLKQVEHVKAEADILARVSHPFIVNLYHRFQDERNLYLIEEFVQNGSLGTHVRKNRQLPNDTARFYAAQVVMAIQFLHSEHIIYRDLNPENVMLDRGHYVKLIDFGLAKGLNLDDPTARTWTLCGTPEYVAPEVIASKGHSKEVDWWALGIVIFEMLAGYPPWYNIKSHAVYNDVIKEQPDTPQHFDPHVKELIKKLLIKERTKRIGSSKNGAEDIKKHKWYRGLNWAALYNKQMAPPLDGVNDVPYITSTCDIKQFDPYPTSSEESGPLLEVSRDASLFGSWESGTSSGAGKH